MTRYSGDRTIDGIIVTRDGEPLEQRLDIAQWSDVGFDWGFIGKPPRQLALAILADHTGDDNRALALAPLFAELVISQMANNWDLTSQDIVEALLAIEEMIGNSVNKPAE